MRKPDWGGRTPLKLRESANALPPDQQQFVRDKQITATWFPVQWLGFLTSLAEWDARADETRGRTGGVLAGGGVGGSLVGVGGGVLSPVPAPGVRPAGF